MVVDDERGMREFLEIMLTRNGHQVVQAKDAQEAIGWLANHGVDLVLTDLRLPRGSGMDVLAYCKRTAPSIQVIMMTAFATTENAIEAMKLGAYDYLIKPFKVDEVSVVIDRALERQRLERENVELKSKLDARLAAGRLLGQSAAMREVYELIAKVAPTRTTVLLTGESGTGKELVARAIHTRGPRADGPFVPVHCAAIPEQLIESELFGHVKGAFTGAAANKPGLFEIASGGTVFLDEISELPLPLQVKLLRVLQERRVRRVGAVEDSEVDVRVIAATNRDLSEAVVSGDFREDLYYRLNVIQIRLPTLHERRADVPLLAEAFLNRFAEEQGRSIEGFTDAAMQLLSDHPWRGNVRELENTVERAVTLSTGTRIDVSDLPGSVISGVSPTAQPAASAPLALDVPDEGLDLESALDAYERILIEKALARAGGVKKRAATLLRVTFRSLRYRLAKLGMAAADSGEAHE
ncbi:MAG: sigma-54-dependent Fis family transcriptional regulator [Deltaproteobacteria bacterium]|nr:sigma-54-dependent Fis family transcriptional regulator [Deltaproteobacteria bacterium]